MADLWYYTQDGRQHGPVTEADLRQLAASGGFKRTELVWKEGMPEWTRADLVKELFPSNEDQAIRRYKPERPPGRDTDKALAEELLQPRKKGMSTGCVVGLILGGVVLVGVLACGGLLFLFLMNVELPR